MTQPSETPRTDIRKFRKGDLYDPSTKAGTLYVSSETEFVEAWFCAAIERELSTARSILADLERQFGKLLAQPKAAPQTRPLEPLQQLGIDREREREASAAPDSGMPLVLKVLVDWEEANGTLAGLQPSEYAALGEALAEASIKQSPRQAAAALSLRGREEKVRRLLASDSWCPACGHNRDTSSVSSIDNEDGTRACQLCGVNWIEVAAAPSAGGEEK